MKAGRFYVPPFFNLKNWERRVCLLNSKGFDLWANDYDKSVNLSEENNAYPFAGYKSVLNEKRKNINRGRFFSD
jgi:hypothetical protein